MTDDLVKRMLHLARPSSWLEAKAPTKDDLFVAQVYLAEGANRITALTAERERLWEALMDAREAWDNHMEYGEPMQGWWVADARAALNTGKEVMPPVPVNPANQSDIGPGGQAVAGAAQCCMCGKRGLSTAEDGGPECELHDGRWVCSSDCYDALAQKGGEP